MSMNPIRSDCLIFEKKLYSKYVCHDEIKKRERVGEIKKKKKNKCCFVRGHVLC